MPKLFKMYGELFMEVEPQPWLIKASKTVKVKLANGQKFCVNVNTGALTVYDPESVQENFVEPKVKREPHFRVTMSGGNHFILSSDFKIANEQLLELDRTYGLQFCVVLSNQNVTPVGYPRGVPYSNFIEKVRSLYMRSYAMCK